MIKETLLKMQKQIAELQSELVEIIDNDSIEDIGNIRLKMNEIEEQIDFLKEVYNV